MEIQAAVTKVENRPIVLVNVTKYLLRNKAHADAFIAELQHAFLGFPVVLMALGGGRQPMLYGCDQFVERLSSAALMSLPWETYQVR